MGSVWSNSRMAPGHQEGSSATSFPVAGITGRAKEWLLHRLHSQPARRAKVLICEDDPSLRELMRLALTGDYSFAEAADVGQAIELVRQYRPDVVLLDVMMPGGSGLEVVAKLRLDPELAETPVLVVSAFTSEPDRRAADDAGADGFLAKPFDPEELATIVGELLTAHRRAA